MSTEFGEENRVKFIKKLKNSINKRVDRIKLEQAGKKNKNVDFTCLELLSEDIKVHITPEIYIHNDFYFNALALKKYAGLKENYSIKASIEHGSGYSNSLWEQDINAPFSSIIVASEHRKTLYEKAGINKNIYKIGPFAHYAKPSISEGRILKEKRRLGKNVLFFPAHSTHWLDSNYNTNKTIKTLKEKTKDFDSVRISLYWKDILRGIAKPYLEAGFECVTSGHIYDRYFLPRHRALIEISDITMSNDQGSHIANSLALGKPHYLFKEDVEYSTEHTHFQNEIEDIYELQNDHIIDKMHEIFGDLSFEINDKQKEFGNYYYGLNELKTPKDMRAILLEIEENYRKISYELT